ncbi:MAG TPA: hypothetical protein PKI11_20255 [Candidatus Hydrogenedentes bacterium]|nr:hypothetical protein [Candidatus Hydrogenedentota bacterium]HNT88473.1 hypothetical protein [Candidatus Hydrogenedentota bacterium]
MKTNDAVYIAAVCIVALVFMALVWRPAGPAEGQAAPTGLGAPGVPRAVDSDLILRLIREHRLSDREAEFYRVLVAPDSPGVP